MVRLPIATWVDLSAAASSSARWGPGAGRSEAEARALVSFSFASLLRTMAKGSRLALESSDGEGSICAR